MTMKLESTAFKHMGDIPSKFTCQGENVSPELSWSNVPQGTQSLVLISDDPDAPDPAVPKMTWVHWVAYDIPPEVDHLPENLGAVESLPDGGMQGITDFNEIGYGGPCPPIGTHRYFFKLYALDTKFNFPAGKTKREIESAMKGHIIDKAELIGRYRK